MFLPLGDAPNDSSKTPWVNYTLIVVNVAVWLGAILTHGSDVGYQAWVRTWGFVPVAPRAETFFTHMFMHGGVLHLAGNMLFLYVFGDNVERRLGHLGYLLFYLACGLAAVLLFRVLGPTSTVPLVGASGAIFGVEGFYFLAFPRNQVRLLVWIILIFTFWVPARLVLGLSFVLNLLYTVSQGVGEGGGVAYAAHVGGFVAGLLLAGTLKVTAPRTERLAARVQDEGDAGRKIATARRLLTEGRGPEAERLLAEVMRRHVYEPEAAEAALLLGLSLARLSGRGDDARAPLRFAARLHPDPGARAEALQELRRQGG